MISAMAQEVGALLALQLASAPRPSPTSSARAAPAPAPTKLISIQFGCITQTRFGPRDSEIDARPLSGFLGPSGGRG